MLGLGLWASISGLPILGFHLRTSISRLQPTSASQASSGRIWETALLSFSIGTLAHLQHRRQQGNWRIRKAALFWVCPLGFDLPSATRKRTACLPQPTGECRTILSGCVLRCNREADLITQQAGCQPHQPCLQCPSHRSDLVAPQLTGREFRAGAFLLFSTAAQQPPHVILSLFGSSYQGCLPGHDPRAGDPCQLFSLQKLSKTSFCLSSLHNADHATRC